MESRVTFLSLADLEEHIRSFERRYETTTVEFLRDENVRAKVSEDDAMSWEAYVEQRRELRELNEETHSSYLGDLEPGRKKIDKGDSTQDKLAA